MNERIKEIIRFPFSSQLYINCKRSSWGGAANVPKYFKGTVSLRKLVFSGFDWSRSKQGDAYWYTYYERGTIPYRSLWGMRRDDLD